MRAAIVVDGRLEVEERPDPRPGLGQIAIRVRAAGINGADLIQRAGRYPAPADAPQDVPGLECAGEVIETGPHAERFAVGDRAVALLGGGGHAEVAVVHERHALPVPDGIEWPEAGGFMEVFATAHDALFSQAGLRPGERLLVNGASGGVGVAGVQLGVTAGARVTGTARSNADRVAALGADTEPEGEYDVILELVGGDNLAANLERLAVGGRVVVIGTGAGARAEIHFGLLMQRRARIHGSTLRARPLEEKALVVQRVGKHVLPLLAAGAVRVPVERTFPLEQAQEAYEAFAAGGKFGKLVLVS
ncbi:MAG TPA: zinc-binding dehydrogenase [Gaiellaceae bacterium]|jgi:NADPH:quinone reductase-like Zn-dependent oxidoreductase